MYRNIKNSSGKITGTTEILEHSITINNLGKPLLIIEDPKIISEVLESKIVPETLRVLYDEYTMSIGEIASLYNRCYSNINQILKKDKTFKSNHCGRRNRAYGHPVNPEQSTKMSVALKGRKAPEYERTPEMRQKISQSLKKYYAEHPQDPMPHKLNWANGKYDNVDFKIGISGHFTSIKMNKTWRFRSLLELAMMLRLENDEEVYEYQYEPFRIDLPNGSSYLPDFLVNNYWVYELKAKKYVERVQGVLEKVEYKSSEAIKYCEKHGFEFKIIYDEDINFTSRTMKAEIKNHPELVEKYHITFTNPSRMV